MEHLTPLSSPQLLFGAVVRTARIKGSLSQDELAYRCRLNRVFMGEVERGEKTVSLETIIKIACGLKTTGANLLREAGL